MALISSSLVGRTLVYNVHHDYTPSRGLRAQFGVLDRVNISEKKVILSPCRTNPMPKVRDAVSEAPGRFNLDAQSAINFWE
ncbi:MAG: hypothetical protein DWQ15_08405 [Proteobacteria bacterium]|nr:MAG: hypothetical protein DWQ15_08405 [Pseudomonadota bacterium]